MAQTYGVFEHNPDGRYPAAAALKVYKREHAAEQYAHSLYRQGVNAVVRPIHEEDAAPVKRVYDPGQPTVPQRMGNGCWSVDSFRGQEAAYTVSLQGQGSCSCPHWTGRLAGTGLDCKHLQAVRVAEWQRATERAKLVPDNGLPLLLAKYEQDGRLDIALAIRAELLDRGLQVAL